MMKRNWGRVFWDSQLNKDIGRLIGGCREVKLKTLKTFRAYCKRIGESWYWSGRIKNKLLYILKFNVIDAFLPKEEVLEENYEMKRVNEKQTEDFVLQNQLHILQCFPKLSACVQDLLSQMPSLGLIHRMNM
ncbi:MAG: hypothetical protein LBC04_01455 [Holosporaceae bacterium]|nr:hypothetical protein [Holosporaceae bacterium]